MTYIDSFLSPFGHVVLKAENDQIISITFSDQSFVSEKSSLVIQDAIEQLKAYFSGVLVDFNFPIELQGTPFQKEVWQELQKISYGMTLSYKEIAIKMGKATAIRAVATAISKNPILIVIPCHRVIASNGNLSGYSGGVARKAQLINLEKNGKK